MLRPMSNIPTILFLLHRTAILRAHSIRSPERLCKFSARQVCRTNSCSCWIQSQQNTYNKYWLHTCPANTARYTTSCGKVTLASKEDQMEAPNGTTKRLLAVPGFEDGTNDVLYTPSSQMPPEGHVVFFGGDIQDYPENMIAHRDNQLYVEWNLENTSAVLAKRFPKRHIWVVKPCRMDLKTFSVYSNFLEFNDLGNPEHSEGQTSWQQLSTIFSNALKRSTEEALSTSTQDHVDFRELPPLTLIGFSKGCVVLNQLLYDLGEARDLSETSNFVGKVSQMIWLDGGHNGGSNTWVHDELILRNLVGTGIGVVSHVTPYQVKDPMRKWLGREHKRFVERLKKLGVSVQNTVHFADEDRSIEKHFKVLTLF